MRRSREPMTLSFPPFTRAVIWLIGINTGVFLLLELLVRVGPELARFIYLNFELVPFEVVQRGEVWQLISYSILHAGFGHLFWNMLALWMFGASIEGAWGTRRFIELYVIGVLGASVTTVALSYAHVLGNPGDATLGASGGVFAILIAFGVLFSESEILMIPFPFSIKAKYMIGILIVATVAMAMSGGGGVAYVAHLGGLFFGWLYVRRGMKPAMVNVNFSERYYGIRNAYYRWKRRRAARKFEVYMRQHDRDDVHFDEHGNYIPPDNEPRKGNGGGKSGWVN